MADTQNSSNAPKTSAAAPIAKAIEAAAAPAVKAVEMTAKAVEATAKAADAPAAKAAPKAAAKPAKRTAKRAKAAPARRAKAVTARRAKAVRKPAARKALPTARKAAAPAAAAARKTAIKTANILNEGSKTMKNEATKVANRVQAVFGDVNERAKTAIERNTRIAEEMTDLGKGNVEALVASTKIAAKAVETLGHEVAEYSRKSFEEASAALKGFAEIKSPTDFFRLQGEFARTQFDSMIAESSKMSEAVIKLAGDVAQPLTNRYSVAAERVKNAVAL